MINTRYNPSKAPGSVRLPGLANNGTGSVPVPVNGNPANSYGLPTSENSNNKLNEQGRAELYNFLITLAKKKNRNSSIDTLLKVNDLEMKHIIMYKYLIIDSFNSKDYVTVNKCYEKLLELLMKKSDNRYIYSLIIYIDIERKFYAKRNKNNTDKFNINIKPINNLYRHGTYDNNL